MQVKFEMSFHKDLVWISSDTAIISLLFRILKFIDFVGTLILLPRFRTLKLNVTLKFFFACLFNLLPVEFSVLERSSMPIV